jgi:hypothetical protein
MNASVAQFERLSFWDLLRKTPVQIPVIQRDYAQGRKSKTGILDSFLSALLHAVNHHPIEVDFIYGDIMDGCFRPLDGQQRLTTLFLLHWYAARVAELPLKDYAEVMKSFSYDTRVSSRDFCRYLVGELVNVNDVTQEDSLSHRIRDYPWFAGSWAFDPTVAGMLTALDKIATLSWPADLWNRLTSRDQPPIRFLKVDLEKFGLTDDLYIKMNARGKPLTPFENFKALLGERIKEKKWEVAIREESRFPFKVDTDWSDCFWNLCPSENSALKQIDAQFLSFINHSLVCSIASHALSGEKEADRLQKLLNDHQVMKADDFEEQEYGDLRQWLELLTKRREAIESEKRQNWEFDQSTTDADISILREIISRIGPQYKRRLILHAQMKLQESSLMLLEEERENWRRLIRNVLTHAVVDSPETFVSALGLINELANKMKGLHEFLASSVIKSGFASTQVKEEQRKARLILSYPDQRTLLHRLEDSKFLRGRITFALDCVNEDPDCEGFDFGLLSQIADVIEGEFGNGINNTIRRSLLTICDGEYFTYWRSWFYSLDLPKHCLLDSYQDFMSFAHRGDLARKYLKPFVLKLIGKSCLQLIAEYEPEPDTPKWRSRLIKEPDLIERATRQYIAFDGPNQIVYPIPGVRPHDNPETQKYLRENKIQ